MFKDEYNKQFEDVAPSPALNEETLALMKEAQEHPLQAPAKPQKMRWVLPVCVSSAAAVLALTIGLAFWFSRPDIMEDFKGDEFFLTPSESEVSSSIGTVNDSDPFGAPLGGNNGTVNDATANNEIANDGTANDSSTDNSGVAEPQKGTTSPPGTTAPDENPKDVSGNAENSNPNDNASSESENSDAETPDSNENVEQSPESEQPNVDGNAQSTPPAEPTDPKLPVEINDKKTETYLSIRAYLDALAAKKTIGYKSNYLADESLIIVPSWLPNTARFRQIYAYANGSYEYSYLFSYEGTDYFLNISVSATLPKTQRDLNLRVSGIAKEEHLTKKNPANWIFYFGNYDKATIAVTAIDGKAIPTEQAAPMLGNFSLARYTVQNTLVEATYN